MESKIKKWEITASTGSHFDVLDGLRGAAILLVVSYHALYINPNMGLWAHLFNWGFIQSGWMGVPVFFVLSGFLIAYPFFQGRETDPQAWLVRGYARRRLAKILPPFYLSIVLFLGFYYLQSEGAANLKPALLWATGLGNFVMARPIFNGSYWSLMVEAHFYIVLPVLFWLTRGLSARRTGTLIFAVLFLTPLIVRQCSWPDGVYVMPEAGSEAQRAIAFTLTRFPCQLDYFAWGVIFAAMFVPLKQKVGLDRLRPLSVLGYAGAGLMVVTMIYGGLWEDQFGTRAHDTRWSVEMAHLLPAAGAFLMLFFVFDPQSLGSRFFSLGWLRYTGIISYEWFLFHGPILAWFYEHSGPSHGSVLAYAWRTIVPLLLTFVFSAVLYRYFSLPIMNRVRDSLKKS